MNKTLMIAAAILSIGTGAATLAPSSAEAGVKFNLYLGGHSNKFYSPSTYCYTDWKKVVVGHKWVYSHKRYKLIKVAIYDWRPVTVCV